MGATLVSQRTASLSLSRCCGLVTPKLQEMLWPRIAPDGPHPPAPSRISCALPAGAGCSGQARRGKPEASIQTPPSPPSFPGLVSPVQYPRRCLESAGNVGSQSLLAGLLRADSPLKSFCFRHMHSGVDPTIGTEAGECAGRLLPGRGPESANHRLCHTGELS